MARIRATGLIAAAAIVLGCRHAASPPEPSTFGQSSGPGAPDAPFVLGAVPSLDPASKQHELAPLLESLSASMGVPVVLSTAASYRGTLSALAARQYDAAYVGPILYVRAHEAGYEPVATPVRRASTHSRGLLIARAGSAVAVPADVRGREVAFVAEGSSTGYQFAVLLLYAHGVRPEEYRKRFLGTHDAVARAVASGAVEVGACYDGAIETALAVPEERARIRVIARTDAVPHDLFAVRKQHPLADRFRAALLALPGSTLGREAMARIRAEGLRPARDEDYDGVRNLDLLVSELVP